MAWKRYKDPGSGDEFTADERAGKAMGLQPLSKDAVDASGRPLPAKKNVDKGGKSAGSKES